MNFSQAESYLDTLQMHKIKLGLEAMQSFLAKVGGPEQRLRFVHVAGTNGKGSVCVTLLTALRQAGFTVGMYTSPHLSTVRERIRLNDEYISEEEFSELAAKVIEVLGGEAITYFEFVTAVALLWYERRQPDLVILETGMGGRLDATNVVTPLVSLVTSISMDHQAYLGDTLTAIATEKAGIIKKNIPVVAAGGAAEVTQVLTKAATAKQAPLYLLGRDFSYENDSGSRWHWHGQTAPLTGEITGLACAMKGAYQHENAALAIAALRLLAGHGFTVDDRSLRAALLAVRWPGRLEFFQLSGDALIPILFQFRLLTPSGGFAATSLKEGGGMKTQVLGQQAPLFEGGGPKGRGEFQGGLTHPEIRNRMSQSLPGVEAKSVRFLLDGAHNADGVAKLAATLRQDYAGLPLILLWGAMSDKDIRSGLAALSPLCQRVVLTRAAGERAAELEQLLACMPTDERHKAILARQPAEALAKAIHLAGETGLVVIAGSLYLLGELRPILLGEIA